MGASASDTLSKYDHFANLGVSFSRGGLALSADYEYPMHQTFGLGGFFRMNQKSEDPAVTGATMLGAFIRPHFHRRGWDLYVAPGFGLMMVDAPSTGEDETALGPSMAVGLLYQLTDSIAVGSEWFMATPWFASSTLRGNQLVNDINARVRFAF